MASTQGIRAGRAFVELFADDSRLVRGLRRAEKKIKAFGSSIRNMGLKMAGLGAALLAPLLGAAKAFSSMGDQIAKMAKRTGMSVEALSELQFVASQTGTEINALENALRRMQRSIYDAGRGLSTAVDALEDLGLKFEDIDGLSPEQQFKLLADRISQIEDPTRKADLAKARKEWRDAVAEARKKRKAKEAGGPDKLEGADDIIARANRAIAGMGDLLGRQAAKIGAQGTFVAANVLGLQTGGVTDRVANGIDKIEKNTRPLRNAQELSFT